MPLIQSITLAAAQSNLRAGERDRHYRSTAEGAHATPMIDDYDAVSGAPRYHRGHECALAPPA